MFFATSGNAVISVILGGVGTSIGAICGSVLLVILKSIIGSWTEHHLIVIGLLFMACVMFLPKGLVGFIRPRIERLLHGERAKASRFAHREYWSSEPPAT